MLAVPALVYLLGQSAGQATTGSLLIVGLAAIAGVVWWSWSLRLPPGGENSSPAGDGPARGSGVRVILAGFSVGVRQPSVRPWR